MKSACCWKLRICQIPSFRESRLSGPIHESLSPYDKLADNRMLWSEFRTCYVLAPSHENTNARAIMLLWSLQKRALASIFPGSYAYLSPKDTAERTLRSISNG